ncbi:hypothetical protein ACFO25_12500 [Paenactinomyces guangxiensis]|nr:hypothetical protein [Paenactinomyces guangxiensis]
MSKKIETQRMDIRVPVQLLKEIEKYQEQQGIHLQLQNKCHQ